MYIEPKNAREIEEAILFLASNYSKTGNNSKPVVLHSINVSCYLLDKGYGKDIIIASLLHDLIEDSDTGLSDIKSRFGNKIADMISALSFDPDINNKIERYKDMFNRTIKKGKETAIIKCADIYDNSFYIKLVDDKELKNYLVDKIKYFLDISENLIKQESVWDDLNNQYMKISKVTKN